MSNITLIIYKNLQFHPLKGGSNLCDFFSPALGNWLANSFLPYSNKVEKYFKIWVFLIITSIDKYTHIEMKLIHVTRIISIRFLLKLQNLQYGLYGFLQNLSFFYKNTQNICINCIL